MVLPQYKTKPIYYEFYALMQDFILGGKIDTHTGDITPAGYRGIKTFLETYITKDSNIINAILTLDYLRRAFGSAGLSFFVKERGDIRVAAMEGNADYINSFISLYEIERKFIREELQELNKLGRLEEILLRDVDVPIAAYGANKFGYVPQIQKLEITQQPKTVQVGYYTPLQQQIGYGQTEVPKKEVFLPGED